MLNQAWFIASPTQPPMPTTSRKPQIYCMAKRKAIKAAKKHEGMTGQLAQTTDQIEKLKAGIRAKVEHPFHIIKNLFKYKKVSYKGIAKNAARHTMLFALANLVIVKNALLSQEHNYVQKTA